MGKGEGEGGSEVISHLMLNGRIGIVFKAPQRIYHKLSNEKL